MSGVKCVADAGSFGVRVAKRIPVATIAITSIAAAVIANGLRERRIGADGVACCESDAMSLADCTADPSAAEFCAVSCRSTTAASLVGATH